MDEPQRAPLSVANVVAIEHIRGNIAEALERGRRVGKESLTAFRDAGEHLAEAKGVLDKGEFGPWAEREFQFSAAWRARLMKLASTWPDVLKALGWASATRAVGRKEHSVDGALALVVEWKNATDPEVRARAEERRARRTSATSSSDATAGEEDTSPEAAVQRDLAEARQRIATLERDNAALRKAKKKAEAEASLRKNVAASYANYRRGNDGTKVREGAYHDLIARAHKAGMSVNALLAKHGLSPITDREAPVLEAA